MGKKTLKIENVNMDLLEKQRKALQGVLNSSKYYRLTTEQIDLLGGVECMLDEWSDKREKEGDSESEEIYVVNIIVDGCISETFAFNSDEKAEKKFISIAKWNGERVEGAHLDDGYISFRNITVTIGSTIVE